MNFIDFHSTTSINTDFGDRATKEGFTALLVITFIFTFFGFKHYSYNVNNFLFLLLIDQAISIITCTILFLINFNLNIPKYKNTVDGNFFCKCNFLSVNKIKNIYSIFNSSYYQSDKRKVF